MYFAVQAMAAELATGALVMFRFKSGRKYRCLLLTTKEFYKKSNRKNYFTCNDGHLIEQAIQETIATGEGKPSYG
jgi:hypothetical protein